MLNKPLGNVPLLEEQRLVADFHRWEATLPTGSRRTRSERRIIAAALGHAEKLQGASMMSERKGICVPTCAPFDKFR